MDKYICFAQNRGFLIISQENLEAQPRYTLDVYAATESTEQSWHNYCMDIGMGIGYTLFKVETTKMFI